MCRVLRFFGWIFLILALAVLAMDLFATMLQGTPRFAAAGELWAAIHRDSLLLAEPALDRHVYPGLWQAVVLPILTWPAVLDLGVPAIVLLLCRRRRRRTGLRR